MPIPITILTGFLGSGKTTLLLNLLPQLPPPPGYRLALLKNEFGDVAVDSRLVSASAVAGVRELLNGCICCNLVGQLGDALRELRATAGKGNGQGQGQGNAGQEGKGQGGKGRGCGVDRIVVETSGSAFPATLAMEVRRLVAEEAAEVEARRKWREERAAAAAAGAAAGDGKEENEGDEEEDDPEPFTLDGVVSVIDVENWRGYADTSYTAKLQASYTDLIIFNKWESAGEAAFDAALDRLGDLDLPTPIPWVRSDRGVVPVDVLFGLDAALLRADADLGGLLPSLSEEKKDNEKEGGGDEKHGHGRGHHHHHTSEVDVLSATLSASPDSPAAIDPTALTALLRAAPKDEVYRIKGLITLSTDHRLPPLNEAGDVNAAAEAAPPEEKNTTAPTQTFILNWAFTRYTLTPVGSVGDGDDNATDSKNKEDKEDKNNNGCQIVARLTFILARDCAASWRYRLLRGWRGGGGLRVLGDAPEGEQHGELVVEKVG